MKNNEIMKTLKEYKEHIEKDGLQVFAIALKGSQNYNLSDEESDIDANLVFIPTLTQLRENEKYEYELEKGKVTCHNIYKFADIVAKGNPQWVEVCNTEYKIGDLSMFAHYKINPSALKGMLMEKVHAFSRLYPSRKKYVEEFGYDPKQLHHIIRLVHLLEKNVKVYKYTDEERDYMLDIKRGRFPYTFEEATAMKDEYVRRLYKVYATRKSAYKEQVVDYDTIDSIVMQHYIEGMK